MLSNDQDEPCGGQLGLMGVLGWVLMEPLQPHAREFGVGCERTAVHDWNPRDVSATPVTLQPCCPEGTSRG